MLQRSGNLRKLVQQALTNSSVLFQESECSLASSTACRRFSNLPQDYASHKVVMPVRSAKRVALNQQPQHSAADAQASSSTAASASTPASALQQGAQTGNHCSSIIDLLHTLFVSGQPLITDLHNPHCLASANAATSWMFPWEKRQMDGRGTPLRTWEKLYWGVFVTAISLFLFNRLKPNPEEAKVSEGLAQATCAFWT